MTDVKFPHAYWRASPRWLAAVLLARATGTAFVTRRRPAHRHTPL